MNVPGGLTPDSANERNKVEMIVAQYSRRLSWVIFAAPALWCALVVLAGLFFPTRIAVSEYLIWSITSLGLFLSTIIVLWVVDRKLTAAVTFVEDTSKGVMVKLAEDVRNYLGTSLIAGENSTHMRRLLLPVLFQFYNSNQRELAIIGADSLLPSWTKFSEYQDAILSQRLQKEEDRIAFEYGLAWHKILSRSSEKILRRYICLLRESELKARTPEFRLRYLQWLQDQILFFRLNENYTLIDTPRAPTWGSFISFTFLGDFVIEVFVSGGGIMISGGPDRVDSVTRTMRKQVIDDYINQRINAPAMTAYSQLNLPEFERYIEHLRLQE
jgi:hypothetical protein